MNIIPLLVAILVFVAKPENQIPQNQQFLKSENPDVEGLLLLQKHCYTCHNPKSKSHDEIIAPPLWGVKNHYLKAYPEKEPFTEAMKSFVQNPNEEKALMKGPIKRFGLMPKPMISDTDLEKIVNYLYENEIENPAWHIEKDNHKNGSEWPRE
ncbi:c-type cytochrome [Algoriphagus kandeliae]|uniref:C-type cytochrome n=1 Tax=Algoriphagus kandeliae TaxID=2562278 RepID=A0A4Y9QTQ6_9BACT|nr:c-type cytochrome [Algoriphagus kandeliae]TFV94593.1 c-type cytochrome [Algoriphagus kandeliae]